MRKQEKCTMDQQPSNDEGMEAGRRKNRISGRFLYTKIAGTRFTDISRTIQSEAIHCDINRIIERFQKTGVLPIQTQGLFGDFTKNTDLMEHQAKIQKARSKFGELSYELRNRFKNIESLLEWLSDSANHEEAVQLGLIAGSLDRPLGGLKKTAASQNTDPLKKEGTSKNEGLKDEKLV